MRNEIKSHARALNCHVVIGYSESSSIVESDICVLSAIGTAVACDLKHNPLGNVAARHRRMFTLQSSRLPIMWFSGRATSQNVTYSGNIHRHIRARESAMPVISHIRKKLHHFV